MKYLESYRVCVLPFSLQEAKNFRVQKAGKKNNTLKTILENLLLKMAFSRIADIQDKNRWVSFCFMLFKYFKNSNCIEIH